MKDKEKQIEEMAKVYCKNPYSCYGYNCLVNSPCIVFETCKELYEQGYRKLPEDSVVLNGSKLAKLVEEVRQEFEHEYKDKVILDKEEYNKVDDTFKMSISDHIAYLRENKRLKEDVQALIGMRFERFNLITKEESEQEVKQASKETAEKFANFIKSKLFDLGNIVNERDINDMLKEFLCTI
jgi:hypothetical protein